MKKKLLSLLVFIPFLASANETTEQYPNSQTILLSILSLKKIGVQTSVIISVLPSKTKVELLNTIPKNIQISNPVEVIDLRALESELTYSIQQTI